MVMVAPETVVHAPADDGRRGVAVEVCTSAWETTVRP
jgi:hypothetical protein